eukprot:GHVP01005031.1.p1 GENE.GHVP01005031.1~~GHVP01005031.1.p1  ORF type:complete len:323 (-),score=42.38 GHVP01005031.1:692-1660(-)
MTSRLSLIQKLETNVKVLWTGVWPNDDILIVSGSNKELIFINKEKSGIYYIENRKKTNHTGSIRSLSYSNHLNEDILAVGSFDKTVSIWRKSGNNWVFETILEGPESEIKSVDWSQSDYEDQLIAVCGRDKTIWIWILDEFTFDCIGVLFGHTGDVKHIKWIPNSEPSIISCSYDGTIRHWHEINGEWCERDIILKADKTIWSISFNEQGNLFVCSSGGSLFLFGNKEDKWSLIKEITAHERDCYSVDIKEISKDSCYIASCGDDNIVRVSCLCYISMEISLIGSYLCGNSVNSVSWNSECILSAVTDEGMVYLFSIEEEIK